MRVQPSIELRGALLALFGIDDLGRNAHAEPERGRGGIRSSIIITVDRPEEVDELTERARAAGSRVTKEPVAAEFFEGRDAYFADPEGNFWEVAWTSATTRWSLPPVALPEGDHARRALDHGGSQVDRPS